MANTYYQIYLQTIFAVKFRNAMISNQWKSQVQAVIGTLINEAGCKTYIVNGTEDHIHCFFGLVPTISVAELMKGVKAKSSKYVNEKKLTRHRFEWQPGYGAFSYSKSSVEQVCSYIKNQEAHHKKLSFREEYAQLLEYMEIPYDRQYVFADPV